MLDGSDRSVGGRAQLQPSADDVRAELERLVAGPELDVPTRARTFLRYIVDETLAGHADRIKAYTAGIEVFERDPSFDAQSDPVVRFEAGRLRRALERYYLVAGLSDPVVIHIPKRGCVPRFAWRTSRAADPSAVPRLRCVASTFQQGENCHEVYCRRLLRLDPGLGCITSGHDGACAGGSEPSDNAVC